MTKILSHHASIVNQTIIMRILFQVLMEKLILK